MTARFEGKAAIVTGGGSGIAQAVCLNMAAEAALVVVADIAPEAGRETVRMVEEQGGVARYVEGDVTVAADCERIVAAAVDALGRLDILANVAGGSLPQYTVADLPEEEWRQLLDLNLTSVFLMSKYAVPRIGEAGGGAIVNVSSGAGVSGMPLNPGYVAAKGGVIALTKAMALDTLRSRSRELRRARPRAHAADAAQPHTRGDRGLRGPQPAQQGRAARGAGRRDQLPRIGSSLVHHGADAQRRRRGQPLALAGRSTRA